MNSLTVGLCYFRNAPTDTIALVRAKIVRCAYFVDQILATSQQRDNLGRILVRPPEGLDLTIIICDNTPAHTEYNMLGLMNQMYDEPWATLTMTVASQTWKGPQPTIAIEAVRYMDYYHVSALPDDLSPMVEAHRAKLYNRGLTTRDWRFVKIVQETQKALNC